MSEDLKTEWRDIWQEIIETSKKNLLEQDVSYKSFSEIEEKYPNDKMVLFEKAITAECLGDAKTAKEFYEKASDEEKGLPVKHWRNRAAYFLRRIEKEGCRNYSKLDTKKSVENAQLDVYFNIHSFYYLEDYLRYLAISSVSRIHSEPAMAIVIFRTCLEIGLWTYFEKDADEINNFLKNKKKMDDYNEYEVDLKTLINQLHRRGLFDERETLNEYEIYKDVKNDGNKAAHPGKLKIGVPPFKYSDKELIIVLDNFNKAMFYLNKHAKEQHQNKLKVDRKKI